MYNLDKTVSYLSPDHGCIIHSNGRKIVSPNARIWYIKSHWLSILGGDIFRTLERIESTNLLTLLYSLDTNLITLLYSLDTNLITLLYSLDTNLITLLYSLDPDLNIIKI